MVTEQANKELIDLKKELENIQEKIRGARNAGYAASPYYAKQTRLYDKISAIENLGLSSKERLRLKKELSNFKTIKYDKYLGSRSSVSIGFSKVLNSYVKVSYTSFNSFMRNVRGVGGLAGTVDLSGFVKISKATYYNILSGIEKKGVKSSVSFMGYQESRNGHVITKPIETPEALSKVL